MRSSDASMCGLAKRCRERVCRSMLPSAATTGGSGGTAPAADSMYVDVDVDVHTAPAGGDTDTTAPDSGSGSGGGAGTVPASAVTAVGLLSLPAVAAEANKACISFTALPPGAYKACTA